MVYPNVVLKVGLSEVIPVASDVEEVVDENIEEEEEALLEEGAKEGGELLPGAWVSGVKKRKPNGVLPGGWRMVDEIEGFNIICIKFCICA